jgi:histidine triad (HIT) family protein
MGNLKSALQNLKQYKATYPETLFSKIAKGQIPCEKVYETSSVLAFRDINPAAPVHIVLVPKHYYGLTQLRNASSLHTLLLGNLMVAAAEVAKQEQLDAGWRLVINDGTDAGQTVFHLHLHILAGRPLSWPPG